MRPWLASALALWLAACSFDWDRYDPRAAGGAAAQGPGGAGGAGGDSGGSGGSGGGTGGAGGGCDEMGGATPAATFGTPTVVAELHIPGVDADDPVFSTDLLELYFNSNRNGLPFTIWRSTRDCPGDVWREPVEVAALVNGLESTSPALAPDGLTLLVSYALDAMVKDFDIYQATRASRDAPWTTPLLVPSLNSSDPDRANWISADGLTVGIDSVRSGNPDLYTARRASVADAWDPPVAISELNDLELQTEAWVSPDGLTLVYGNEPSGTDGEIYRAERSSVADPWSSPQPISEINSSADESDPWLSPDGRLIMFTRELAGDAVIHRALR